MSIPNAHTPHYTVTVPYAERARTQWHPTDRTGPFHTIQRGAFSTPEDAIRWAETHLDAIARTEWFITRVRPFLHNDRESDYFHYTRVFHARAER